MRDTQYRKIITIMRTQPHDNRTTKQVQDRHHLEKGYSIQIGTRINYLVRAGYITSQPIDQKIKHLYHGMECFYKLTDLGRTKEIHKIIIDEIYKKELKVRSSQEESHIKKQNKQLNKEEWIKFEQFKKEYSWNSEEGMRERTIHFTLPPAIKTNWFVRLKNFLSFNTNTND